MTDQAIGIKISDKLIKDVVHQEIFKSISENHEALIAAVVKEALWGGPEYSRYNESHFTKACKAMVAEVAKEAFKEWLEEHRQLVKEKMVTEMSKNKGKKIKEFVDKLIDGTSAFHAHVQVSYKELNADD